MSLCTLYVIVAFVCAEHRRGAAVERVGDGDRVVRGRRVARRAGAELERRIAHSPSCPSCSRRLCHVTVAWLLSMP